ncbi:MAG TPA: UpxY family transcription antiterminator [Bacteroidetes bacterium]|nr:UpxY family transcription antiterminator [Bacteroidota bacterium]
MGSEKGKKINKELWYAIYVRSRHEKKVYDLLTEDGITSYLPVERKLKLWSDRKKWVTEPLFRSYVFVFINIADYPVYLKVLQTEGVVKFVRFGGVPVPIPEKHMEAIRIYEKSGEFISEEEEQELKVGDEVEVIGGALKGVFGRLVEIRKKRKVRIMIDGLNQSVYVDIRKSFLKPTNTNT